LRTEKVGAQLMRLTQATTWKLIGSVVIGLTTLNLVALSRFDSGQTQEAQQSPSAAATARPVGTIKAISGNAITLATDAGSVVNVLVQDSVRIVRIAPGEKDLKGAVPMQFPELQIGDRILVRGNPSDDGKSVVAISVIVIKATDVAAKQERDREDWQKRGVGGLVTTVDPGTSTVALSTSAAGANKTVTIHVSKDTIVRRYLPDSVKFDDAKLGTFAEIKPGDQLRARGTRSADGNELTAEEIVSGTFRNVAGLVTSTDLSNNTVNVMDLATRKPVALKINADSQLRKLPPTVAQRIAARLKGVPAEGAPGAAVAGGGPSAEGKLSEAPGRGNGGGSRPSGAPDFQQMLSRMPAVTLADLQKGDAVMIVSTQGTANTAPTAITLLSGVEPILSASPDSSRAAMLLSPWNLGGGGETAAGTTP
jgi:hypothetical protein